MLKRRVRSSMRSDPAFSCMASSTLSSSPDLDCLAAYSWLAESSAGQPDQPAKPCNLMVDMNYSFMHRLYPTRQHTAYSIPRLSTMLDTWNIEVNVRNILSDVKWKSERNEPILEAGGQFQHTVLSYVPVPVKKGCGDPRMSSKIDWIWVDCPTQRIRTRCQ
jgi:hypothetical protein